MDIFGACVLGGATAVGGGLIRDLILGYIPPAMFRDPIYVLVSCIVSLIAFVWLYRTEGNKSKEMLLRLNGILNWADSIGLAAFVVVGCRTAIYKGYADYMFLCAFVGVLTGIGGGILRDIFAGQMPLIMRKRIYGIAAILGACIYIALYQWGVNTIAATVISMILIIVIRKAAILFCWNLPKL